MYAGGSSPVAESQPHDDRAHSIQGARKNFLTLLGQATSFIFGAVASRLFGQAAWGSYTTAFAWVDVLVRTSVLAGDKALLVFVPARRAEGDEAGATRAVGVALRISAIASVLAAIVMLIASFPVAAISDVPLHGTAMRILAPFVVVSALSMTLLAATMAVKVLDYNLYAKGLVEPLLMLSLAAGLGFTVGSLPALAVVPVLSGTAALVIAVGGVRRLFVLRDVLASARREKIDRAHLRFVLPLAVSEFLNIVSMRLGSLVLVAYVAAAPIAVFNTSALLASTVSYVRGAFDTVLGPIASEAWATKNLGRLATNLQAQSRMVLLFAVPLASVFIVGGGAVLSVYGPGYTWGHGTLAWLTLAHVVNATLGLVGWVLMAAHETRAMMVNNIIKVAVELVLLLLLIPLLGIEGAAIATAAAILTLQLLQVWEVWRLAKIHPFSVGMVRIGLLGVVVILAELLAYRHLGGPVFLRAGIPLAVGTPLYFLVAWRWRDMQRS